MSNIFHQSVEDILRAATPEQKIIWNWIFLQFGERAPVSQLVYTGQLTTSELFVYRATKYYFAYELEISRETPAVDTIVNFVQANNALNNPAFSYYSQIPFWDATAAEVRFTSVNLVTRNIAFSRLNRAGSNPFIKFIGYRIGS